MQNNKDRTLFSRTRVEKLVHRAKEMDIKKENWLKPTETWSKIQKFKNHFETISATITTTL